ncbi:MAG: T9SS type A sorting domain-containing protein, partial [Flammeovirgaceae bacterium]|nr:T9SS type A sorting domain-containing protein [Flammeovirgaceae bacterium]
CTELLPDRFFIFLRNIPKNSHATPNFKKRYLSISHLHHVFGRVRKTGGQIVVSKKVNGKETSVDFSDLGSGIYLIRLHSRDNLVHFKIMKR